MSQQAVYIFILKTMGAFKDLTQGEWKQSDGVGCGVSILLDAVKIKKHLVEISIKISFLFYEVYIYIYNVIYINKCIFYVIFYNYNVYML